MKPISNPKQPLASIHTLALLAILTALSVAGRLLFTMIPNVQPSTTLAIFITLLFGWRCGLTHVIAMVFLSNLFLGMGPWFFPQIGAFSVVVLLTALLQPFQHRVSIYIMAAFAGFTGFLFGFIVSLGQMPVYGFHYFWVYYLAGLPFDLNHAVGNVIFYFVLAPTLMPLLRRICARYEADL